MDRAAIERRRAAARQRALAEIEKRREFQENLPKRLHRSRPVRLLQEPIDLSQSTQSFDEEHKDLDTKWRTENPREIEQRERKSAQEVRRLVAQRRAVKYAVQESEKRIESAIRDGEAPSTINSEKKVFEARKARFDHLTELLAKSIHKSSDVRIARENSRAAQSSIDSNDANTLNLADDAGLTPSEAPQNLA